MVWRLEPGWSNVGELTLRTLLLAPALVACSPIVVEAFEPPLADSVANEPVSCPPGSLEVEPGRCGCDTPDDDFDADGTADCLDECPDNAGAIAPAGACGCSSSTELDACSQLRAGLRNLYTFGGPGTAILDTRGEAHGTLRHISDDPSVLLDGLQLHGRLTLDGQGSYVDLPDGMISSLGDATFEAWLSWRGGEPWARIFDFGDNGGTPVDGVTYLFLTASSAGGDLRVAYSVAGPLAETIADGGAALPVHAGPGDDAPDQVVVVIDRSNAALRLYANGVELAARNQLVDLSALNDVNNWLGRSNYLVDPPLAALWLEFRIYSQALTATQIEASYRAGPGALD